MKSYWFGRFTTILKSCDVRVRVDLDALVNSKVTLKVVPASNDKAA